jgi:hypothetical protein
MAYRPSSTAGMAARCDVEPASLCTLPMPHLGWALRLAGSSLSYGSIAGEDRNVMLTRQIWPRQNVSDGMSLDSRSTRGGVAEDVDGWAMRLDARFCAASVAQRSR